MEKRGKYVRLIKTGWKKDKNVDRDIALFDGRNKLSCIVNQAMYICGVEMENGGWYIPPFNFFLPSLVEFAFGKVPELECKKNSKRLH